MHDAPLFLVAVLALAVAVSEWLVRRTFLRHFGTALLVILVTAVAANAGLIPTGTRGVPLYEGVFAHVAPLGIFWLLLGVRLGDLRHAGGPMVALFLVGAAGTTAGAFLGMALVDGRETLGPAFAAVGGMFTGTYTGGSANFNAIAIQYDVQAEGLVYTGSIAVDNVYTTVWMVVTIALPRLLGRFRPRRDASGAMLAPAEALTGEAEDTETVHPLDLALVVALGGLAVWASRAGSAWIEAGSGREVPWVLLLTTFALLLAQVPAVRALRGTRLLGMFAVYLFLAVIGAYCDLGEFARIGSLGVALFVFAGTVVATHGLFVFGAAALLRLDRDVAAVASQANIGGGTSALALARSLGRADLVLPAILVGSLGTGLGTYLGLLVVRLLGG